MDRDRLINYGQAQLQLNRGQRPFRLSHKAQAARLRLLHLGQKLLSVTRSSSSLTETTQSITLHTLTTSTLTPTPRLEILNGTGSAIAKGAGPSVEYGTDLGSVNVFSASLEWIPVPASGVFTLANSGNGPLQISDIKVQYDPDWGCPGVFGLASASASLIGTVLDAGQTANFTIDYITSPCTLPEFVYQSFGTVIVTSNDTLNSPYQFGVAIVGTFIPTPRLEIRNGTGFVIPKGAGPGVADGTDLGSVNVFNASSEWIPVPISGFFTLANSGIGAALQITDIQVQYDNSWGCPGVFGLASASASLIGTVLEVGQTANLTIDYITDSRCTLTDFVYQSFGTVIVVSNDTLNSPYQFEVAVVGLP